MSQVSIGGGRGGGAGFNWTPRDLGGEELAALESVVSKVAARLRGEELGDAPAGDLAKLKKQRERDREALRLAAEHIEALERENAELRRALDER